MIGGISELDLRLPMVIAGIAIVVLVPSCFGAASRTARLRFCAAARGFPVPHLLFTLRTYLFPDPAGHLHRSLALRAGRSRRSHELARGVSICNRFRACRVDAPAHRRDARHAPALGMDAPAGAPQRHPAATHVDRTYRRLDGARGIAAAPGRPGSTSSKAGRDSINGDTIVGAWHFFGGNGVGHRCGGRRGPCRGGLRADVEGGADDPVDLDRNRAHRGCVARVATVVGRSPDRARALPLADASCRTAGGLGGADAHRARHRRIFRAARGSADALGSGKRPLRAAARLVPHDADPGRPGSAQIRTHSIRISNWTTARTGTMSTRRSGRSR